MEKSKIKKIAFIGGGIFLLLLVAVVVWIQLGNQDDQTAQETTFEAAQVESNEDLNSVRAEVVDVENAPTIWTFNETAFDNWSIPTPPMNPLGEEQQYTEVSYILNDYIDFYYLDQQLYPQQRTSYGNLWRMTLPKTANPADPEHAFYMRDFKRYLKNLGGQIEGSSDGDLYFSIKDASGYQTWGHLSPQSDTYTLTLIKERALLLGTTMKINPDDFPDGYVNFMTYADDALFNSAYVTLTEGQANLEVRQRLQYNAYVREQNYQTDFDSNIETRYQLNDLPLDGSDSVWRLSWDDAPEGLEITLNSLGPLTPIRGSEDLGAVVISAKEAQSVAFFPDGQYAYIAHPEYRGEPVVDRTEAGDFLVYLPSGHWRAEITPKGDSLVTKYGAQLIPVQPGYITQVEMPYLLERALAVDDTGLTANSGLKIGAVRDLGDRVAFDFSLIDSNVKGLLPQLDNTKVHESGQPAELISITSVKTPPSVALLIDSSGSMKGQMNATLDAAKAFIEGLPTDTHIRVVDFDSEVRVFDGTTQQEAIQALKKISVGGYTALYDGVLESLALIDTLERSTLVVFTDGTNELPAAQIGPNITQMETVLEAVGQSDVQLMTIGFGKGHDGTVLKALAKAGQGGYYRADDQKALSAIFKAINDKINATYTATYKRPVQGASSDVPIVNIVVDVSGSMDMEWDETTGFRMEKMKNLFHTFIEQLPENTQIQLMSFNEEVTINQMMTSDKQKVYRALGLLEAGGGTNILDSVRVGYQTLAALPSTKKVMVYLTDAAFSVEEEEKDELDHILKDIEQEGVNVLWIGLGEGLNPDDFEKAAALSGGDYVLTENPDELANGVDALLKRIPQDKVSEGTALSISVNLKDDDGSSSYYGASTLAKLPALKGTETLALTDSVKYITNVKLDQYDANSARFLSGERMPKDAIKILKRMPLTGKKSNSAMEIDAKELILMGAFNGIPAPTGMRFAAILTDITHILPKQEVTIYPDGSGHPANWVGSSEAGGKTVVQEIPYVIPNVFNHFSLQVNEEGSFPMSTATWIAEKPLVNPGESALELMPHSDREGALIFLIPESGIKNLSLHYYDTDYGHIHLPLIGEMPQMSENLDQLPEEVGTAFHKGFSMQIAQVDKVYDIGKRATPNTNNQYQILSGRFKSQVQANLVLNPSERMHLLIPSDHGAFYLPIDPATELLTFGINNELMVSPGADNPIRMAFLVPEILANYGSELMVDLVEDDVNIPAQTGPLFSDSKSKMDPVTFSHDYFDLTVNNLVFHEGTLGDLGSNYAVLDLTVTDHPDGFATRGVLDAMRLVKDGFELEALLAYTDLDAYHEKRLEKALSSSGLSGFASPQLIESPELVAAHDLTSNLLLGFDDDTIVYDGTARRGFVVFKIDENPGYTLQSTFFKDMRVPLQNGSFEGDLLTSKMALDLDDTFQTALDSAITLAIDTYNAQKTALSLSQSKLESLDPNRQLAPSVDPPMMALSGALKWNAIDTMDALINSLNAVDVRYDLRESSDYQSQYRWAHDPEAILTQGWGNIADLTQAFIRGLSKLGYQPRTHMVKLNDYGRTQLSSYLGVEAHGVYQLPAVAFDYNGEQHVWLMPYMMDFNKLGSHGSFTKNADTNVQADTLTMKISYLVALNPDSFAAKQADAASALSGGSADYAPYWEEVLYEDLSLADLSKGCMDVGVTMIKDGYTPFVKTLSNTYTGEIGIDPNGYDIKGVKIELYLKGNPMQHVTLFPEETDIEGVFTTLGVNLPSGDEKSFETLFATARTIKDPIKKTDEISALRWYGHSAVAKFLALQSSFERELAKAYNLKLAHIGQDPAIVVTQMMVNGNIESRMDLLNPVTRALVPDDVDESLKKKLNSYYLMSGIHASIAESRALENGMGIMEMWSSLPDDTNYFLIPPNQYRTSFDDKFSALGMKEEMLEYFNDNPNYILIAGKPAQVMGQAKWSWIEINPATYDTLAVLDDFTHGAMGEKVVTDALKSGAQYMIGVMAGIDVSLWSVSSFSLEYTDYETIRKMAYEYALGMKSFFNLNSGPFSIDPGSSEGSMGVGPIKGNIDFTDGKLSLGENVLGFGNGFEEGVKLYFDISK